MDERRLIFRKLGQSTWNVSHMLKQIKGKLKQLSPAALFSASLGLLLEQMNSMSFLTKISLLIVANLASLGNEVGVNLQDGKVAVISIDTARYVNAYDERSPLNRCQLSKDLKDLFGKNPKMVAIDLDLSPLVHPSPKEESCQQELDALLDRESRRSVLLTPFTTGNYDQQQNKFAWMRARCEAGSDFADGTLIQTLGSVTVRRYLSQDQLSLAGVLHNKALFSDVIHGFTICSDVMQGQAAANKWLQAQDDEPRLQKDHEVPINYAEAARSLAMLQFGSEAYHSVTTLSGVNVVFGGSWGQSDSFLTPLGRLPGAAIHGMSAISIDHPVSKLSHLIGFLLDIVLGLVFGLIVMYAWTSYGAAVMHDHVAQRSAVSTVVMFLLVLSYSFFASLAMWLAIRLYAVFNIEIVPLLMGLSMLIDGFVNGPREALEHSSKHMAHGQDHGYIQLSSWVKKLGALFYWIRWAIFRLVIGLALFVLISHLLH
jgi:hypothetical protein